MKKLISFLVIMLVASIAFAGDFFVYDGGKQGVVTFYHVKHQNRTECIGCHVSGNTLKIPVEGKDVAHAFCKDCHKSSKASVSCNFCHKK